MKVKHQQSPFICDLELTRPASNFKKSFDLILICLFSNIYKILSLKNKSKVFIGLDTKSMSINKIGVKAELTN